MKPKSGEIEFVDKLIEQVRGFYNEVAVLSKAKPDNPLNRFKLNLINGILTQANSILVGEFQPLKDFTVFQDTELPSNSDVVVVLSQYLARLQALRSSKRASSTPRPIDLGDL